MRITDSFIRDLKYCSCNYTPIYSHELYSWDDNYIHVTILLLSFLHKQGRINDQRLKAMFKSLKAGTLLRKINTYHCPINNKWYNDASIFSILMEVYLERAIPLENREMSIDDFLKYLNLYYNANRNYCVDRLTTDYILPLLKKSVNDYRAEKVLKDWGIMELTESFSYEDVEDKWGLSDGYCCSDCDGCLGEYKRNRWKDRVELHYKAFVKGLAVKLKRFKTHNKNPNDILNNLKSSPEINYW